MDGSAHQKNAHGDVDHGFGEVDASFVVAHEAAPAYEPAERSFDHPAPEQHLEVGVGIDTAYHFDYEIEENGLVQQLPTTVGAVGEKMLDSWPALADSVEDHLRAGAVRDVGWPEIDHQRLPVSVDYNVALAPNHLLGRVIASLSARRICLDGRAVDNTGARAGFAPGPLAVIHQGDVVDRDLMWLSNRGGDVKYLRAWRCVCRVHGCLRGQHRSPHDGASRDEPSMWTTHFAESAVQPCGGRPPHQVNRTKQHQPYKAPIPPVDRLPEREHTPAAARARHLADRVENLTQVNALPTSALGWFRQQLQSAPIPHHRSDYSSSSARFGPSGLASLVSTT